MNIKSWIATAILVCCIYFNINRIINDDNYYQFVRRTGGQIGKVHQLDTFEKTWEIVGTTFVIGLFGMMIIGGLMDDKDE